MKRMFTFVKTELVEYEIEVEARSFEEAQREYEKAVETGDYSLQPGDPTHLETFVCCEVCGERLEINDACNLIVNRNTDRERVVCDECVCGSQNAAKFVFCRQCFEFYQPDLFITDPTTGNACICPNCGGNAFKEE